MEYLVNAEQMKQCDMTMIQDIGIPSLVLMERAALAVVSEIVGGDFVTQSVLVVCGVGNNGGDGFAIARLLHLKSIKVEVMVVGDEQFFTEDAKKQKEILEKYHIPVVNYFHIKEEGIIDDICEKHTCIVDALFGIGLSRPITDDYLEVIQGMDFALAEVIAVDIPSGISADSGKVMGAAVHAKKTVTFAFRKIGQLLYPGTDYCGEVIIADIGITREGLEKARPTCYTYGDEIREYLPKRKNYSNKGTYGKGLLIVGKRDMAGAAVLAAEAAYRSGSGLISVLSAKSNRVIIQSRLPEAISHTYNEGDFLAKIQDSIRGMTAVGVGSGLGIDKEKFIGIAYLLQNLRVPLVLDADALNMLSQNMDLLKEHQQEVIVTPHITEMMRLTGLTKETLLDDLISACKSFAREYQVICIVKDTRTIISDGNQVYINQTGCNGMATGGSGDVLTGIITGLLTSGCNPFAAAVLGVYFHGKAGEMAAKELGMRGMLAGDIIRFLPSVLGEHCEK